LQKEYRALLTEPRPNIEAHPRADNILEWHYVLTGPADSPYFGGVYHGKVIFPGDYPFKAPSIVMCTPSGRFAPNAKICMSMTDFHPESWQPAWSVGTILTGLLSFMLEEAPTSGSVNSTAEEKQQLAAQSLDFNVANLQFKRLFPGWVERQQQAKQQQQEGQAQA
jgi:ubiquitin-conjugating enzyme E2 J2